MRKSEPAGRPSAAGPAELLLGLGANIGRPVDQLRDAVSALSAILGRPEVSSLYRTVPVGYADQEDFFNLVCRIETRVSMESVFAETSRIERELGRKRSFRDAPRTLDIDILAYGTETIESEDLSIPHPRLHERAFVLVPLVEVAPRWRHPRLGYTAEQLLRRLGPIGGVERWADPFPA